MRSEISGSGYTFLTVFALSASKSMKLSQTPSPTTEHVFVHLNASKSPKEITFVCRPFGLLCPMPANRTLMASVEQSSPSKVPLLTAGDITPVVMRQFKHGCQNYFIHKKILADDQVSLIIGGLLDSCMNDWISADRDRIIALSFNAFMVDFRANYLAKDWEEDTLRELLSMTKGGPSFWDFAITVQSASLSTSSTSIAFPLIKN